MAQNLRRFSEHVSTRQLTESGQRDTTQHQVRVELHFAADQSSQVEAVAARAVDLRFRRDLSSDLRNEFTHGTDQAPSEGLSPDGEREVLALLDSAQGAKDQALERYTLLELVDSKV